MKHCVYFLIDNGTVVYVGMSGNVESRLKNHIYSDKVFDSHRIMFVSDKSTANEYERRWIRKFKPKYNIILLYEKESITFWLKSSLMKKIRRIAKTEQKTISIIVENSLDIAYGI